MEKMTSRRSLSSKFLFFAMVTLVGLIISCYGEELAGGSAPQVSTTSEVMKDVRQRNKDYNNVQVRKGNRKNGGGGGWGWGGGGGGGGGGGSSGSIGGGGGWGWGGGGGGWWGWGCMSPKRHQHNEGGDGGGGGGGHKKKKKKKRRFSNEDYKIGEFAECMGEGRCQGMRLDCPLHCGGPCFYDCKSMCKAHCRPPQH